MTTPDYYEFLQISRSAEPATIQRVFRFLAGRLHPDNPETGDAEKFILLRQAYEVLSDRERRTEYDAAYNNEPPRPIPLSDSVDFMDDIEGEMNRRLALLALLYNQRRTSPYKPEVSLLTVEARMGFPRDYLQFTTWYLRNKKYITQADNSDFTLTVLGVDFVESNRKDIPVLNRLLTTGTGSSTMDGVAASEVSTPPNIRSEHTRMLPALEEALRQRICSSCIDRNGDRTCSLNSRQECALFERLPKIAQSICRFQSENIDDYMTAIREDICAACPEQDGDGLCKQRDEIRCVLDRYWPQIAGAIEEVRGAKTQVPGQRSS